MYAQFYIRILTGVWRFESLGVRAPGKGKAKAKTFVRSGWSEGYGYDEYEKEEDEDDEEENEDFYLAKDDKQSEKCPKWNIRWRVRETGEGVIELYSDRELCTVTFSRPGRCKMSGVLHNEFVGDCTFMVSRWTRSRGKAGVIFGSSGEIITSVLMRGSGW
jgi:hypothetical protein